MTSRNASKLERHKKQIKHKLYINLLLVTAVSAGLGFFLSTSLQGPLTVFFSQANALMILMLILFIFLIV